MGKDEEWGQRLACGARERGAELRDAAARTAMGGGVCPLLRRGARALWRQRHAGGGPGAPSLGGHRCAGAMTTALHEPPPSPGLEARSGAGRAAEPGGQQRCAGASQPEGRETGQGLGPGSARPLPTSTRTDRTCGAWRQGRSPQPSARDSPSARWPEGARCLPPSETAGARNRGQHGG